MTFIGSGYNKPSDPFAGTLSGQVYRQLRDDIVIGRLAPGERLVRRALAKRFDVSVIPILEALLRLENDGLVDYEEKIGARVSTITIDLLNTHRVIRESMEIHMARMFAAGAAKSARDRILAMAAAIDENHVRFSSLAHDDLHAAYHVHYGYHDDLRTAFRAHYDFHLAIPTLAGYPGVAAEMRSVWFKRLLFFSNVNLIEEPAIGPHLHMPLAEALTSGDADLAAQRMHLHLGRNKENYHHALSRFLAIPDEKLRRDLFLVDEDGSPNLPGDA